MDYNNKSRAITYPIFLVMAVLLGMFINSFFQQGNNRDSGLFALPPSNKLDAVLEMIDRDYVDTVSVNKLVEQAIPSLLKDLDPHTVYIAAKDLRKVNEELKGNFGGIGVQFMVFRDTVTVVRVIPGGPSEKSGIIAGDRIVRVDDTIIAGVKMKDTQIMERLKGEIGTEVKVSLARRGEASPIDMKIVRGQIPVPSVDVAYMLDDKIGYIKVTRFAATTFMEFSRGIASLKREGMKSLIVDLRGNQGGYLAEATNMINEFLPNRKTIVTLRVRLSHEPIICPMVKVDVRICPL